MESVTMRDESMRGEAEVSEENGEDSKSVAKLSLHALDSRLPDSSDDSTSDREITYYDAIRIMDGPSDLSFESELWTKESDLLTVLRQCAPAGAYEIWVHRGNASDFFSWRIGRYGTSWRSEPHAGVVKDERGFEVMCFGDLEHMQAQRLEELELAYGNEDTVSAFPVR